MFFNQSAIYESNNYTVDSLKVHPPSNFDPLNFYTEIFDNVTTTFSAKQDLSYSENIISVIFNPRYKIELAQR